MTPRRPRDGTASLPMPEALATDLDATFEDFVRAYQGRLFGFALRLCGDRQDAEEIVQDAFTRAYRALRGYEAERIRTLALRSWLFKIGLNVWRNHARRRRPRTVSLDPGGPAGARPDFPEPAVDGRHAPDATVERAATGTTLADLVTALPTRYRAAVVLRHIEGLTYPELADILQQPLGTVKSNVHRGTAQLRAAWVRYARTEET